MLDEKKLGKKLKELRASKKYTQSDAAKLVDISAPAYSAYESGKSIPTLNTIIIFAEHYGVSLDWLCGLGEDKNSIFSLDDFYSESAEKKPQAKPKVKAFDKVIAAAMFYKFLVTLPASDKKIFFSGNMKSSQFTESPEFKKLTLEQKFYLFQAYEDEVWQKIIEE